MRQKYLVLTPNEIAKYIQDQANIEATVDELPNKITELSAGLILSRFNLKQTGKHSNIAFPLNNERYVDSIDESINNIDKDTPIDILLVDVDIHTNTPLRKKTKALAFQLKRFKLEGENSTNRLIGFLTKKVPNHYAAVEGTLVIILHGIGQINLKEINNKISKLKSYPFSNIIYLSGKGNHNITIGELWPQNDYDIYTKKEWFDDLLQGEQ